MTICHNSFHLILQRKYTENLRKIKIDLKHKQYHVRFLPKSCRFVAKTSWTVTPMGVTVQLGLFAWLKPVIVRRISFYRIPRTYEDIHALPESLPTKPDGAPPFLFRSQGCPRSGSPCQQSKERNCRAQIVTGC